MMYLKFMVKASDDSESRVIATKDFSTVRDDKGLRIYYEDGMWERVSNEDWLNCFVMSDTGKTIDVFHAPKTNKIDMSGRPESPPIPPKKTVG